jgi:hypothetical protein
MKGTPALFSGRIVKQTGALFLLFAFVPLFSACELYEYGKLGGADKTSYYEHRDEFDDLLQSLSGVWYSHYAGVGRLDGYRIGKWKDFTKLVIDTGKNKLFPNWKKEESGETCTGYVPDPEDYFVLYDGSVYGQTDDNSAEEPPDWGGNFGYCGIVRAVNLFYNNPDRGAIIIEYLKGCDPQWLNRWPESSGGKRPFFGIYYRVLNPDLAQMANAVDLAALYNGEKYYTETATLQDAIDSNTVENEAEHISWGVVIPQGREPE